ncbi:rRNA biogenesis protein rrp36 [Tieghemiomyces parasiticus]|uniref:rRNA biogenesis protein RRP36 n=1 Tax=Tieghemiomyces parasiticus TaxID=78921 RepID=A0A9W7ZWX5_9FUNG|nr:rRNA biogenesis protein rrp36 [Tieghemiomyces parasiticus]
MSTKRPVSHFREVIEVQRRETRDPRFDSLAGKFNEDMFKKSFSFVNDLKQSEIKDLRERIKACDDRDVKEDLKEELRHLIDETKREKNEDRRKQLHRDIKKREVEMVKQGKKPYFLKKSEAKKLELADRFQRIKDPQQLERVIEKRRKKNAAKEERGLPYRNRYGN